MKTIIITIVLLSFTLKGFSQEVEKPLKPLVPIEPTETLNTTAPNIEGVVNIYDVLPAVVSEKCTTFFKSLMTEAANKAYNDLLDGSPIKINDDKVKNQVIKTIEAIELYGKIEAYELIGSDEISTSYMKVKYLSLHAYNPLLWTFTFYNSPKNGWIVINMKLTDEL